MRKYKISADEFGWIKVRVLSSEKANCFETWLCPSVNSALQQIEDDMCDSEFVAVSFKYGQEIVLHKLGIKVKRL